MQKIALKACRHCAFTRHHLGTHEEVVAALDILAQSGYSLKCHEYSEPTVCASFAAKNKIKGELRQCKGDLKAQYGNITKAQKESCGLGGLKIYDQS